MRDLTADEILYVSGAGAGDPGEDIIVTGSYGPSGVTFTSSPFNSGGGIYTPPTAVTGGGNGGGSGSSSTVKYNVVLHDPLGLKDPLQTTAAQNLLAAIHEIDAKLSVLAPQVEIQTVQGVSTVGTVLSELRNTVFYVDTSNTANNGGVGAVSRINGHIEDHLDYHSFDGNLSNSGGKDYAAPTFNGQGMIGIVLHEIGHGLQNGVAFHTQSQQYWRREVGNAVPASSYYSSAYSINEERAMNDFSKAVTSAAGISQNLYSPTYGYFGERPGDLFADRGHN